MGVATVAAGAGVILAITSVMAHSTQSASVHASSKSAIASLMNTADLKQDAAERTAQIEAAKTKAMALAAKIAKQQAAAAEEAAESTTDEANEDGVANQTETDTDNDTTETDNETADTDNDQTQTEDNNDTTDTESD